MHFLFESSLGVLPLDPLVFFHYLDPHVCPRIWHIENSRPSLWNPRYSEKGDLPQRFAGTFSCYAIFKWIWTYKTHDLTDYQLNIGSFLPAITFMWSDRQIPRWPQFFQQQLFPSVPSLVDFNRAIISRLGSFHIDVCSFGHACPFIPFFSNLRCARRMIHPGNCSAAPSLVCFNRPIVFQSLLLEFSCPNPATPIARDHLTDSICVFPAGGSWRAVGVGRLPIDVSTRRRVTPGFLARSSTISHLSRPGCTRPRPWGPGRRGRRPGCAATRVDAHDLAFDKHFNPWRTGSNMICAMCILAWAFSNSSLPHKPPRTGRHEKSGSQRFHKEFQFVLTVWSPLEKSAHRNLSCLWRGTKDQRRYIVVDRQVFCCIGPFPAPFRLMTLPLAIYTRSSLSSHSGSTQTVPKTVHAKASVFTRSLLKSSWPWLRRNLSVLLGSIFSWVLNMYISSNGIPPWIFSHSDEFSPLSSARRLCLYISSNRQFQQLIPCSVRPPNCKNFPCFGQE